MPEPEVVVIEEEPVEEEEESEPEPSEDDQEDAAQDNKDSLPGDQIVEQVPISFRPWQKKASAAEINNLMKRKVVKLPEIIIEKPPPVDLRIDKISRNGDIDIKFNQPLFVPEFESNDESRGRQLIKLSEIDVGRDLFEVSFFQLSDSSVYPIQFSMDILEWTELKMRVNLNFTDSLTVS